MVGYRTISIAGCRDPYMIAAIDERHRAGRRGWGTTSARTHRSVHLEFRLYGRDGVMGRWSRLVATCPSSWALSLRWLRRHRSRLTRLCAFARSTMLHCSYAGRIATAGNLAFPYSPSDLHAGGSTASACITCSSRRPVRILPNRLHRGVSDMASSGNVEAGKTTRCQSPTSAHGEKQEQRTLRIDARPGVQRLGATICH